MDRSDKERMFYLMILMLMLMVILVLLVGEIYYSLSTDCARTPITYTTDGWMDGRY